MRTVADRAAILKEMRGSPEGAVAATPDISARADRQGRVRVSSLAIDVALVSGLSLVLGLIRLGSPSFWYDEAYTYRQIGRSYLEQFEGYQPFYYWIVKPWTSVFGTSEWAMRFPSVVGAMLACALLVVLTRRLFDRRVSLVSGLLLAASPFMVKWSQQARAYTMLVALGLVATLLLLRAVERGTRSAWAIYGVAFTALLVTHVVTALLLAPAHVVLVAQRRVRVVPHGLLAAVIVAALGVPWAAQLAMRTNSETSETAWIPFPSADYVGGTVLAVSGAAGLGVVLAALGLVTLYRAQDGACALWLATWALAPFVVAVVVSLARPVFVDRYFAVAAPAYAILAAVGLCGLVGRRRSVALAACLAATVVGLVVWYRTVDDGNWRGEDWRSAVAAVTERRDEADAVVVVPWWSHDAVEYYGTRAVATTPAADSIWVLHWSEDGPDLPADLRAQLGFADHELLEKQQFGWRLSAQLWQRPPRRCSS